MSNDDSERAERDDRTIFISGITEKVTDKLLYELFFQAGPVERVSIPKEKDGKNKTFAFVEYKHENTVAYALAIYTGTKLFGRELLLKYRSSNKNSARPSLESPSPLVNPLFQASLMGFNMMPQQLPMQAPIFTQDMLQQQLLQMATAPDFGSHRDRSTRDERNDFVDRHRNRRDEGRNHRSRPYDRSRSPPQHRNHRDKSPNYRNRDSDRERRRDNRGSNYSRWNY